MENQTERKSFSGAVRPRAGKPGLECACELSVEIVVVVWQ